MGEHQRRPLEQLAAEAAVDVDVGRFKGGGDDAATGHGLEQMVLRRQHLPVAGITEQPEGFGDADR